MLDNSDGTISSAHTHRLTFIFLAGPNPTTRELACGDVPVTSAKSCIGASRNSAFVGKSNLIRCAQGYEPLPRDTIVPEGKVGKGARRLGFYCVDVVQIGQMLGFYATAM